MNENVNYGSTSQTGMYRQAHFDGVMAAVQRTVTNAGAMMGTQTLIGATLDSNSKGAGANMDAGPMAKKMRVDDGSVVVPTMMTLNSVVDQVNNHENNHGILPAPMMSAPEASSRDRWMMKLGELRMYKAVHGTCNVPRNCKTCPQLGKWVNNQRFEYKKISQGKPSKMTEERILLLEAEGFSWSVSEHVPWETRYQQLVAFKEKYNHCRVPKRYPENQQLANWVCTT